MAKSPARARSSARASSARPSAPAQPGDGKGDDGSARPQRELKHIQHVPLGLVRVFKPGKRAERGTAGKDSKTRQQNALRRPQQSPTPIEHGSQGALARQRVARASGKGPEPVLPLAFVQSSGPNSIGWAGTGTISGDALPDGSTILSQIQALRAIGGNVTICFGGSAGTDPASASSSAVALQAQYQSVIDRYGVTSLDFDIEGAQVANPAAIALRDQALINLETVNPGLKISFTLPVLPTGLDSNGVNVLQSAAKAGVRIDVVNIMAMDYGGSQDNGGAMGLDAIDAIKATEQQIAAAGLTAKVGVTPMIGVNDIASEVFTLSDAQQLASYVQADPNVAQVSMWSTGRDNGAGAGQTYASPNTSGVAETAYQFAGILQHA